MALIDPTLLDVIQDQRRGAEPTRAASPPATARSAGPERRVSFHGANVSVIPDQDPDGQLAPLPPPAVAPAKSAMRKSPSSSSVASGGGSGGASGAATGPKPGVVIRKPPRTFEPVKSSVRPVIAAAPLSATAAREEFDRLRSLEDVEKQTRSTFDDENAHLRHEAVSLPWTQQRQRLAALKLQEEEETTRRRQWDVRHGEREAKLLMSLPENSEDILELLRIEGERDARLLVCVCVCACACVFVCVCAGAGVYVCVSLPLSPPPPLSLSLFADLQWCFRSRDVCESDRVLCVFCACETTLPSLPSVHLPHTA